MNNKYIKNLALLLALVSISDAAVTINVIAPGGGGGAYLDSTGASLGADLLRFGFFNELGYDALSENQKNTFAEVDALFTEVDSFLGSVSGTFVLTNGNDYAGLSQGNQLYTWVFNHSTAEGASEWGIFSSTNSLWDVPADVGSASLSNTTIDNIVFGTSVGSNNFHLAVVPEPSAYAAIAGVLVLGFTAVRRRRRA